MFDNGWGAAWNTLQEKAPPSPCASPPQPVPVTPKPPPSPEDWLKELHRRRVAAHPDKEGGSHEGFLAANAEYEAWKGKLRP